MGAVGRWYISKGTINYTIKIFVYWVYVVVHVVNRSLGYIEVVAAAAEDSMKLAVNEIKDMAHYKDKGEVHLNVHVHMYFLSM